MMCEDVKQNRSVAKTKRQLRKALNIMLRTVDINKISVKQLTQVADLSRATFYVYYSNVEEFFQDTINYFYSIISKQLIKFLEDGRENAAANCKRKNLLLTEEDIELFTTLINCNSNFYFIHNGMTYGCIAVSDYLKKTFGDEYYNNNFSRIHFFVRGYVFTMNENMVNYDPEKNYRDLIRIFNLWDFLFRNRNDI